MINSVQKECANLFLEYLNHEDIKSGAFGEEDPKVKTIHDDIVVMIYSQTGSFKVYFEPDEKITAIFVEDDESGATEDVFSKNLSILLKKNIVQYSHLNFPAIMNFVTFGLNQI